MSLTKNDSTGAMASLMSYGGGDSDPDSDDETKTAKTELSKAGLVAYTGDEDKMAAYLGVEGEDVDVISDDEIPQVQGLASVAGDSDLDTSVSSESALALSESIRRSFSVDEGDVVLPPEPTGRCSKHLQDKISKYYKKTGFSLKDIEKRKDFRNPSIYDKLITYLKIDELGSNYPKDVFNPHGWDESSYYEALAKIQKEDMAKREKEKKDRTKVEFKMGMAKKPTPPNLAMTTATSTANVATTTASTVTTAQTTATTVQPLMSISTAPPITSMVTTDEPERKRKSKWGVSLGDAGRTAPPLLPLPTPLQPFPIAVIPPQISIIGALVTNPVALAAVMPAPPVPKTTVISSIGVLKKPKTDK